MLDALLNTILSPTGFLEFVTLTSLAAAVCLASDASSAAERLAADPRPRPEVTFEEVES